MDKKGQVTLFVIIAILIITVALFFFLVIKPKIIETQKLSNEAKITNARAYVLTKMEEISQGYIALLYLQGGFIEPENYISTIQNTKIPIYTIKNNISRPEVPSLENISGDSNKVLKEYLENISFENFDYVSNLSIKKANITLAESAFIEIDYSIGIKVGDFSTIVSEKIRDEFSFDFKKMLEISKNITKSHEVNGVRIDTNNLNEMIKNYNVDITIDIADIGTLVYVTREKEPKEGVFYIAVKNEI